MPPVAGKLAGRRCGREGSYARQPGGFEGFLGIEQPLLSPPIHRRFPSQQRLHRRVPLDLRVKLRSTPRR